MRGPNDGKPFYCIVCGAGYGEYAACEEVDCKLESEDDARERAERHEREQKGKSE
jgi:hypothetical protein